ncbi:MAG: hypothetical protein ACOYBE_05670 [Blautia sp.]
MRKLPGKPSTQAKLLEEIGRKRSKLDSQIKSREDLAKCQKLSEELDELIVEYQRLINEE